MPIAYKALSVTERAAVDEAVDAASAKFNDWGIDVPTDCIEKFFLRLLSFV